MKVKSSLSALIKEILQNNDICCLEMTALISIKAINWSESNANKEGPSHKYI